jgi:hypothetical protein
MAIPATSAVAASGPWLAAAAFFVGILPDSLLRRLRQQVGSRGHAASATTTGLDAPELERQLPGLSLHQASQLGECGIETPQDLATKDLGDLLLLGGFDPPQLLSWVDRALLCDAAGAGMVQLDQVRILSATELLAVARHPDGLARLAATCAAAAPSGPERDPLALLDDDDEPPLSRARLQVMVAALERMPNLALLRRYWAATTVTDGGPGGTTATSAPSGTEAAAGDNGAATRTDTHQATA